MPDYSKFVPATELELFLDRAHRGQSLPHVVTETLKSAHVFVLVDRAMQPGVWDPAATPLMITDEAGGAAIAIFTHPSRAEGWAERTPSHTHLQQVSMQWLVKSVGEGVGIALNLGWPVSLAIPPDRVADLKA